MTPTAPHDSPTIPSDSAKAPDDSPTVPDDSVVPGRDRPVISARDRHRGCLLGLAVGDALGGPVEFKRPGTFPPVRDMIGGGCWQLRPGEWTDDTSMALCLAASLAQCGRFDPEDQMSRYVRWLREGYMTPRDQANPKDVGCTTSTALRKFEDTSDPWAGSTDPRSAGNGSLMRLAPVPMFFARTPSEAVDHAAASSKTTHAAAEAVDACRYYAGLLVGALNGETKEALLEKRYSPVAGLWERNPLRGGIATVADGSFKRKEPPEIKGTGYVVESMEAALWAFNKSTNFDDGVLAAVNLGNDADTTAAVYGQLAGAHYGVECIRREWRRVVAKHDVIVALADRLLDASEDR